MGFLNTVHDRCMCLCFGYDGGGWPGWIGWKVEVMALPVDGHLFDVRRLAFDGVPVEVPFVFGVGPVSVSSFAGTAMK